MDVTTVEKSLRRIADSSDKRYDEVEKQNAKFIIAALDNGLVECTEIFQDIYYRFKIAGSKRVYEVCFGIDPPKTGEHARAERALRASGFIIDLQGLIDKEYNCYVVPDVDIRGPKASKLRERVFGADSEVLVTEAKGEKGSGSAAVSYGFVYELEVMINAAVDYDGGRNYEYVRINDSVVVEARVEGEKLSVSYEHKHIDRKTAKDAKVENISEEQLSTVRKVLAYVASNEEKRKILEELAKSEESGFSKRFLSLLPNMKGVRVGQVSVEPCAIYVDRIPNKTFAYDVTLKGHTQPFVLKLTWNDLDTRFKMTTPLYVVAGEDGSFEGFTYESEYAVSQNGEEKIARGKYDEECKLVVAYGYEGKKSGKAEKPVPMALTLAPSNPASVKHGEKFKGISDWAVKLTAVSPKLDGVNPDGYYLCSSVVRLETQTADGVAIGTEGVYLKGDCSVCEYLGKDVLLWNGDLSDEEVSYIDAKGEVKKGRIPKAILNGKGKKTCPCCTSVYYADDARWAKYQEKNKLLDGNYSCDNCKEDYETV